MRTPIKLELNPELKTAKSKADKQIDIAFKAIFERKSTQTIDAEDIAFVVARRAYLTDEQLKHITGKTFAELEKEQDKKVDKKTKKEDK